MRTTLVLLLSALALAVAAAEAAQRDRGHLRPQTRASAELVDRAIAQVPEVTALVRALDDSDVFVYVTDVAIGGPSDPPAYLRFMTCVAGRRLLLIRVDGRPFMAADRMAMLAHELQHAVEIAAHPEVRDVASLADLYRRIGWEGRHGYFETEAAREMTKFVRRRYAGRSR